MFDDISTFNSKNKKRPHRALIIALLLSIFLVHLPLLYLFIQQEIVAQTTKPKTQKQNVVMVDLKNATLPQQVVDISKPAVEKIPTNATAQSLYNSSVKDETVSSHFSKNNVPLGQAPQSTQSSPQKPPSKQNQTTQNDKAVDKTPADQPPPTNQPLTLQDELKALANEQKQEQQKKYDDLFENKNPTNAQAFTTSIGSPNGGNTDDYLPDYKIGSRTFINTLANPNIGYFVELRRKFRFAFNPVPALRAHINQISRGKISVVWGVSVDGNGNLSGLTLIRSSGLPAYDNEAKRTIATSAPFSRPPLQILSEDQQLHMAWTFVVYM